MIVRRRIGLLPDGAPDSAIVRIRMHGVYDRLTGKPGWSLRFCEAALTPADVAFLDDASVLVIQRLYFPFLAAAICDRAARRGIPIVYELDDLLTAMPADHPEFSSYRWRSRFVAWMLRRAEAVTVSTRELARQVRIDAERVHVVPGQPAHEATSPVTVPRRSRSGRLRIGFAGTPTHGPDLALIRDACLEIDRRHSRALEWCFYGCEPEWSAGLERVRRFPPQSDRASFFRRWRAAPFAIGLAPLNDTPFNTCKDLTKFHDYAHLGAAGIFSRVPPYSTGLRSGHEGLLVANTTAAWIRAMDRLIRDAGLRRALVRHARRRIRAARRAEDARLRSWLPAFLSSLRPEAAAESWPVINARLPVALFGTGPMADRLRRSLEALGHHVVAHVETRPAHRRHAGLPVVSPATLDPSRVKVAIASLSHGAAMHDALVSLGWLYGRDFL